MRKLKRLFYEIEYFDAKYPYFKYLVVLILMLYAFIGKDILKMSLSLFVLIVSVILHEISHGYVAYLFGDDTAKRQGRLSLNPLKHIDLMGLLLPLLLIIVRSPIIIGSAKPVPVNYYALRRKKYAIFLVNIAGILCNLLLVILCLVILQKIPNIQKTYFSQILLQFAIQNLVLVVFNLLPIPPLDGSKIMLQIIPSLYGNIYYFLERNPIFSFILMYFILVNTNILNNMFTYIWKILLLIIS